MDNITPNGLTELWDQAFPLLGCGRYQEGMDMLKVILEIDPTQWVAYYTMASTLVYLEDYAGAIHYAGKSRAVPGLKAEQIGQIDSLIADILQQNHKSANETNFETDFRG